MDPAAGEDLLSASDGPLEQQGLRSDGRPLAVVEDGHEGDVAAAAGQPSDDHGDGVEEFSRHGDDTLAVALGWCHNVARPGTGDLGSSLQTTPSGVLGASNVSSYR